MHYGRCMHIKKRWTSKICRFISCLFFKCSSISNFFTTWDVFLLFILYMPLSNNQLITISGILTYSALKRFCFSVFDYSEFGKPLGDTHYVLQKKYYIHLLPHGLYHCCKNKKNALLSVSGNWFLLYLLKTQWEGQYCCRYYVEHNFPPFKMETKLAIKLGLIHYFLWKEMSVLHH